MRMDGGGSHPPASMDFDPQQKITKPRSTSTNQTLQSLQTPLIPFLHFPSPSPPQNKSQNCFFSCRKKIPRFHENGGSKGCIQDMLYGCHLLGQARCHSNGPTTRADAARYRGLDLEAIFRIRQQIIQPWREVWWVRCS